MSNRLVEVKDLCRFFRVSGGKTLKAVDHVSFHIDSGETLGLVGESGCGKTTCGRTVLRLYEATSGSVFFDGCDVAALRGVDVLSFKRAVQIIFQDPWSSLDPRMTIGEIIAEGLTVHWHSASGEERQARVREMLSRVGLREDYANRFAHELSGGQRQRVGIARALAIKPRFIVCDEPISALDVSIQAQIVNLLMKLQREEDLTYLFISHDLSMVRHISDRVGIMYLGSLVEMGPCEVIYSEALHPYTKALLSAIPQANPGGPSLQDRDRLDGEVPSPIDPPSGCKFRTRCVYAQPHCSLEMPLFEEVELGRYVACHRWREIRQISQKEKRKELYE